MKKLMFVLTVLMMVLLTAPSRAIDETVMTPDTEKELKASEEVPQGWSKSANLGVNLSLTSNKQVIGQEDGDSKTYGFNLDSKLFFKSDQRESRTTISLKGATTSTPPVNRYIKSSDELVITSIYLYSLKNTPWLGPYARVRAQTAIFKGEHVQKKVDCSTGTPEYGYTINGTDWSTNPAGSPRYDACATSFKLTDPFKPLTTAQSLGVFAKALDRKTHKLIFRVGYGALQVSADGQFTLDDADDSDNVINIKSLESYSQQGLEVGFDWMYDIDGKTSMTAAFDSLYPLGATLADDHPECPGCTGSELAVIEAGFKLSSKVYEWMSLSYEINYKRQPQLLSGDQIQNMMLLNFGYNLL